jgi:hypothetical protein
MGRALVRPLALPRHEVGADTSALPANLNQSDLFKKIVSDLAVEHLGSIIGGLAGRGGKFRRLE